MDYNIHRLDGTLPPYNFRVVYTGTCKEKEEVKKLLDLPLGDSSMAVMRILVNSVGTTMGYDKRNDISIDHLLYELATLIPFIDSYILDVINSYLVEMKTGMCHEGRSHRLRQILFII
jgi:hypothetical protein